MKRSFFAAVLLILIAATPARAQFYHQLGGYGAGGYSSMASSSDIVSPGRGCHTSLGFTYELQMSHLLFQTGLGLTWQSAGVSVADSSFILPGLTIDTQNKPFHMGITTEERTDYSRMGYLQIPAMVGGIYGHLYFLGGLKLNVPLWGVTRTKARFTTMGYYDDYLQPVTAASFHGFFNDYPGSCRGPKMKTSPVDLMGSFEVGYNYSMTEDMVHMGARVVRETRLRISAYFDYSLLPLQHSATFDAFSLDANYPYDIDRFTPAHILNTESTAGTYLANFNVGVKFTFLFGSRQRFICLNCESAVEAGINNPGTGRPRKDNTRTNTRHPDTNPTRDHGAK